MSPIKLNGSTSGFIALDAPAAAGSNTLVLPTGNGSSGQYLQTNGSGTLSWSTSGLPAQALTLGTSVASTSGTSIDFTGIPSTVKRITVIFNGVSLSGSAVGLIRLGTSSGIVSTGYASGLIYTGTGTAGGNRTDGFGWNGVTADPANVCHGHAWITNVSGNTWTQSFLIGQSNAGYALIGGGSVTLSSTLDRVRITSSNGTDTFDAGTINIMYEG